MIIKKFIIILFLTFSISPTYHALAQSSNTGFVSGNIWYSKDPFEEGDKVKIYTFIFNPDSRELSGTVLFFDKTVLLGKKNFAIPPKRAGDISIDWNVRAGDHTIFGKIENSKFLISKGVYEEVYLRDNETEKSSTTVSKKIISTNKSADMGDKPALSSIAVSDIKKIIGEKAPEFISEPIISTANKLEEVRENINFVTEAKKEEVKKEIETLKNKETMPKENKTPSIILKPFKYAELFFLSVFSFILNNRIIFYGFLIVVVFSILRFIFNRIFN